MKIFGTFGWRAAIVLAATVWLMSPAVPLWAEDKPADKPAAEAGKEAAKTEPGKDDAKKAEETKAPDPYYKKTEVDPTGGNNGVGINVAPDGKGDDPAKLSPSDIADRVAHNWFSINLVWTLLAGALVMFMQTGFALVEGGLCRAKNSSHTFAMNMLIYPLGCFAFYVYGFAIGWGNWYNAPVPDGWTPQMGYGTAVLNKGWGIEEQKGDDGKPNGVYKYGICGTRGFFLMYSTDDKHELKPLDDVGIMTLFFFMMVFMDTTATIPTGAMAERWTWKNFVLYGFWIALPYCLYANWVWGGGWLAQSGKNWEFGHGAVDFAGSGVVHAMGGVLALAGAIVLGPRIGKFVHGKPHAIPGHNIPFVITGTFILAFGWFGFNAGSTLAGTDLRIATVVVNTMLASVTGTLACMFFMMSPIMNMKPDPSMMCNGMLAGLVAITAPCAFVDSWAACLIGAVAGVLVVVSVFFWDRMGIDDPVGAISVHGVNGIWGVLSLGIFANGRYGAGWNGVDRFAKLDDAGKEKWTKTVGVAYDGVRGLLYGDSGQFSAQLASAVTVIVFGFLMGYVWFKLSDLITPIRVSRETELEGLDIPEMGALGYPDFVTKGGMLDT